MLGVIGAALALTPVGVASAADYEAIGDRLKQAVGNDEISAEQARVLLAALRDTEAKDVDDKHLDDKKGSTEAAAVEDKQSAAATKQKYADLEAMLGKAVADGTLSVEDARAKLAAFKLELAGEKTVKGNKDSDPKSELAERKAVTGLEGIDLKPEPAADAEKAFAEVREALAAGSISRKDALARLDALRAELASVGEGSDQGA